MQPQIENPKSLDPLLSPKQVAKILGICVRSLRRLWDRGELPRPVRVGRSLRMFTSDVEAYLQRLRGQRAN